MASARFVNEAKQKHLDSASLSRPPRSQLAGFTESGPKISRCTFFVARRTLMRSTMVSLCEEWERRSLRDKEKLVAPEHGPHVPQSS